MTFLFDILLLWLVNCNLGKKVFPRGEQPCRGGDFIFMDHFTDQDPDSPGTTLNFDEVPEYHDAYSVEGDAEVEF